MGLAMDEINMDKRGFFSDYLFIKREIQKQWFGFEPVKQDPQLPEPGKSPGQMLERFCCKTQKCTMNLQGCSENLKKESWDESMDLFCLP